MKTGNISHNILLNRQETWVGLSGTVLKWFKSILKEGIFFVTIGSYKLDQMTLTHGVPQESVLGPLLFSLYATIR